MKTPDEFRKDVYEKSKVYENKKKKTKRIISTCLSLFLCFGIVFLSAKQFFRKESNNQYGEKEGINVVERYVVSGDVSDEESEISEEVEWKSEDVFPTAEAVHEDGYFLLAKSASAADIAKLVNNTKKETGRNFDEKFKASFMDFASEMLKYSYKSGKNALISPASALYALGMTANGATDRVQSDMLHAFADGLTMDELNAYLCDYHSRSLVSGDGYTLSLADSVWFRNDGTLKVKDSFLKKVTSFYDADIFGVPYDETTANDINKWVKNKTHGMIDKIYDKDKDFTDTVLTLINTLLFDAEWENTNLEFSGATFDFTNGNNEKEEAKCFGYTEKLKYIETDDTVGFLKNYNGGKYAFAAFLPKDGIGIDKYVSSLDGAKTAKLIGLLSKSKTQLTSIIVPEFDYAVDFPMNDMLKELGMESAFYGGFENMAVSEWGDIYIGSVFQKTHITMSPRGTTAAAVTVVEMLLECDPAFDEPVKIILNRPFVYAIIDTETNLPIFIGAVNTVK